MPDLDGLTTLQGIIEERDALRAEVARLKGQLSEVGKTADALHNTVLQQSRENTALKEQIAAAQWHRTTAHMPPSDETVLGFWRFEDEEGEWPIYETCVYCPADGPGRWLSGSGLDAPDYWQRLTSPLDAAPDAAEDGAQ